MESFEAFCSVDKGKVCLPLKRHFPYTFFLRTWRNIFTLCSRMHELWESQCSTYSCHWRGSYFLSWSNFLPLHLTGLMCWPPGRQNFITAEAQFRMFGKAHIDLFGPGSPLSCPPHETVAVRELRVCTCQVIRVALMKLKLDPFQEPSVWGPFDLENLFIFARLFV